MKVSRIVLVLAIALAVATIVMPAAAQCFGGWGCGVPLGLGACGFGVPFGVTGGSAFQSSFTATSSFNTFGGVAGCGVPLGFCGVPFGLGACGLGFGGCGFGMPFGFC